MKSALEIAHDAKLRPITDIAKAAGIQSSELEQYGELRAKVKLATLDRLKSGKSGKVVIVTGAGRGIGRATVRRFVEEGALLVAVDRRLTPTRT